MRRRSPRFELLGGSEPVPVNELVIVAGQSNAAVAGVTGSSGLPAAWVDTPRVQMWNNGSSVFETYNPAAATFWGPEVQFALDWLLANPAGTLYLVKKYLGGSQLGAIATYGNLGGAAFDWSFTSGHLYEQTTALVTPAKAACGLAASYVLWAQGEADALDAPATADYAANCNALYAAIRTDWGDANTKICAHTVSNTFGSYDFVGMTAQQRSVVAGNANNFLADTRGFARDVDNIHLLAAGAVELGHAMYAKTHQVGVQWWDNLAIFDFDFANSRFYIRNIEYSSVAAMVTAGRYVVDASGDKVGLTGMVPTVYTMLAEGVNSATPPSTTQAAFALDDDDGVNANNRVLVSRSISGVNVWGLVVHTGGVNQTGSLQVTTGAVDGAPFKIAARIKVNSMNIAANGTAGTQDTSASLSSAIKRLIIKNAELGTVPLVGTLNRITMMDADYSNAQLVTAST